ncbi:MAG: amidohydrolase family protein [Gemmatimonadaceae bacterium]
MRRCIASGVVAATMLSASMANAQTQTVTTGMAPFVSVNSPIVALTHARVVDGTGAPARTDQTIIIRGPRIIEVGPSATVKSPAGAQVVDLTGQTVLPGQVALHEHTYFGGVKRLTQMSVSGPLLYLAYGITTAMTAGSQLPYHELNMKAAVDAGVLPGPHFFITGPYLNGGPPRNGMSRNVSSADDTRRVIDYWATEGATWIKFLGAESREVLGAGIKEAHVRGLKVTAHLCSVTFTEAAALGIDLLQHGFITNSDYVAGKKPDVCPAENMRIQADVDVNSAAVQSSIRTIVASGSAVVSTLGVYETFMPEQPLETRALDFLAPDTRLEVEATHADLAKAGLLVPPRLLQKMMKWERDFVAAGGLLGAGCDPWGTGFLPGIGNLRNYELLVQAGFAPEMAVRIMTLNGARILGIDARTGSIAVGKSADLMVVRGDPVASPTAIYDVVTVFQDGIGFDSERLRRAAKGRVGVD